MAKKSNGQATETEVLDLPCSFGNVSIGEGTASVKLAVERKFLSLTKADRTLCGHRLEVRLLVHRDGTALDQGALDGMDDTVELPAIADVKKVSLSSKAIGFGLTFSLKDIDVGDLALFAKKQGKVCIDSVGEIPEKSGKADEETPEED